VLACAGDVTAIGVAEARGLTPLVGRDRELAQLEACFERARDGLAQVAAVVGQAGSGKSRLLYELRRRLADEPVALFEARCSSIASSVPHAPWIGMLQRYLGLVSGEPAEEATRKVEEAVEDAGDKKAWILPVLLDLLSLPTPGIDKIAAGDFKRRAFDAVDWVVTRAGLERPVLMIVEDLHWIDDASREMLDLAVSRFDTGTAMLLVTHRPQYRSSWSSTVAFTQLGLRPLPDAEAISIVRHHAGGQLPTELEARILNKGEGNPFFLEELTRSLVEEGAVVVGDGRAATARPADEIRIPDSLHDLIGARLDRLRPAAKRTVQVASAIGRQFERRQLERLLAGEDPDLDSELDELESLGVIHRKTDLTGGDEYRFGESLMQEVAYESLLLRERRQLHGRIAEVTAEDCCRRGEGLADSALMARHYARSDEPEKGIELLLRAATEAERLPSYGDAANLYRETWELAEATLSNARDNRSQLLKLTLRSALGVCTVAVLYGTDHALGERAAVRAEELARELGDEESLVRCMALRGGALISSGPARFEDGIATIERAVEVAKRAGLTRLIATASRGLALAYTFDGRFEEAQAVLDHVFVELERTGERETLSDAYLGSRFFQTRLHLASDDLASAESYAHETLELARRAENRTMASMGLSTLATVTFVRGAYAEAETWAQQALSLGIEIGSAAAVRTGQLIALGVRLRAGDRSASSEELDRIDHGLVSGGGRASDAPLMVEVLLGAGAVDRAERLAHAGFDSAGGQLARARVSVALGQVDLARGPGCWAEAEHRFGAALETSSTLGARSTIALSHLGLAQLAADRRDRDTARRQARLAEEIFEELGMAHYAEAAGRVAGE